jgi:hypothetical protein
LSGLQADSSVQKLPADIENRNVPGSPDGRDVAVEADVPVIAVRYYGTIYDFVLLNAIIDDSTPQATIDQASFTLNKYWSSNTNYKN